MSRHSAPHPGDGTSTTRVLAAQALDVPVLRVLWLLGRGMNMAWSLQDLADREAVRRAIHQGLVAPPHAELIAFHLTDAGRARIVDWYTALRERRRDPEVRALWHAVTRH